MELDSLDTRLLVALVADARLSLRELARRVDSTPPTVAARLKRLVDQGLVRGYAARLDPDRLPGRTRLVSGRVPKERAEGLAEAVPSMTGVLEGTLHKDGRFQLVLQLLDLDTEERILAELTEAGAHDLTVRPTRRLLGPGPAHLFAGAVAIQEPCAFCGRPVDEDPVEETVDNRRVTFCCTSCRQLYLDRYARLKAGA